MEPLGTTTAVQRAPVHSYDQTGRYESTDPLLFEANATLVEQYLWQSLPLELQSMVYSYLPQHAISHCLQVALLNRREYEVALLEKLLYRKPYLRLELGLTHRFHGLTVRRHRDRLAKVRDLLIHVTPEADRTCLAIMRNFNALLDLPQSISNLRVVAFTDESRVTAQTERLFLEFFERHLSTLDVLSIPTWYDGEKLEKNFAWGVSPHRLQKWDFFHPKNDEELNSVVLHNEAALGDSRNSFEFDRSTRMPKLIETTGSPMMVFKLRRYSDSRTHEYGKEVEIFVNHDAPAYYCRKLLEEDRGRKVVSITIDNSGAKSLVPLHPILKCLGWRSILEHLKEFRVTHLDLEEYGGLMISEDEDDTDDFLVSAVKSLKIQDCVGIRSFLDGCHAASIDLSSLIFGLPRRKIEKNEEIAPCTVIESCSNLQTLCLSYDKAKLMTEDTSALAKGLTELPFWAENISDDEQYDYCDFPLARILPRIGHSLKSLHLSADPSLRLRKEDPALIAVECANLTGLGIPFPALTEATTPDEFRKEISHLTVLCDLKALQYLQLSCAPDQNDPSDENEQKPSIESITRHVLYMIVKERVLVSLKYFTVAFRTVTSTSETCHLHIRSNAYDFERVPEKKLGRDMEAFGHCERGGWNGMVRKRTGLELPRVDKNGSKDGISEEHLMDSAPYGHVDPWSTASR